MRDYITELLRAFVLEFGDSDFAFHFTGKRQAGPSTSLQPPLRRPATSPITVVDTSPSSGSSIQASTSTASAVISDREEESDPSLRRSLSESSVMEVLVNDRSPSVISVSDSDSEGSHLQQFWKFFLDMQHHNYTKVTEILLLGIPNLESFNVCFFLLLLIIYCVTVCGNLLIILVVSYSRSLDSPMYFFLTQLSFTDLLLTTTIVPNLLHIVLHKGSFISFIGCLTQYYFFSAAEALECLLLTVMSYDRYQAICNPLHYTSIMDLTFCIKAVLLCWLVIFATVLMLFLTVSHFDFCGPNVIDHFFCDLEPLLELSCSDTFILKLETVFLVLFLAICPVIVIIVSYAYIIFTILKIPSVTGRKKTFSTCSAHLSVVSLYYGSLITTYVFPRQQNAKTLLSLFYTVVTPLLNPMIYSLSNTDIKQALKKLFNNLFVGFNLNWAVGLSASPHKEKPHLALYSSS
ncbi:olfactory receptor 1468-like [Eleutherodactylus coqui]|uniref:olfactory receptor 1468-like n=1 Tax=Eleutherodactylus coqui TaxID=57060 RepID=UPI003461D0D7